MKFKTTFKIVSIAIVTLSILSLGTTVFAAGNCAFSVGANYGSGDIDTSDPALFAYSKYKQMGYSSYYTTEPTFSELNGYFKNGTRRLESDILFLDGHGWRDGHGIAFPNVDVWYGTTEEGAKWVGIANMNWNTTKLVVYAGCYTAKAGEDNHITVETFRRGAKSALGWHQDVGTISLRQWTNNFNEKIAQGSSFSAAFNYANSQDYNDNNVKDLGIYGDWNMTYRSSRSGNTLENPNTIYVTENIEFNEANQNIEGIFQLVESINQNFNKDNYETKIFILNKEDNFYSIDLTRKVDGYLTNSGYVIAINNGKVVSITNNDKDIITPRSIMRTLTNDEKQIYLEDAKTNAITEAKNGEFGSLFKDEVNITKQTSNYYYNVETNTKYFRVLSTIENANGVVCVAEYSKEI